MKYLFLFFAVIGAVSLLYSEIELRYAEITEMSPEDDFTMFVNIDKGYESISELFLVLKGIGGGEEKRYKMNMEKGTAYIIIGKEDLIKGNFYYYFETVLKDRTVELYPENASVRMKNSVAVSEGYELKEFKIILLAPATPDDVSEAKPLIAIYVEKKLANPVIIFDGTNVTKECRFSNHIAAYKVKKNLSPGRHRIDVIGDGIILKTLYINMNIKKIIGSLLNVDLGLRADYASSEGYSGVLPGSAGVLSYMNSSFQGGPLFYFTGFSISQPVNLGDFNRNRYMLSIEHREGKVVLGSHTGFKNPTPIIVEKAPSVVAFVLVCSLL